ncbi:MAG: hypothetical protein Q8O92_15030 [Candidatus Latescibacter sp.]|nr:hypothetical protein [Candidatus Latescibacter sp.]
MTGIRTCIILIVLSCFTVSSLPAQTKAEREKKRMELNAQFDKMKLREKTDFVMDTSEKFLLAPSSPKEKLVGDFVVAKVPPIAKLRILPNMIPEYITEEGAQYMAGWANWGHVIRSEDSRFFFSVGDHRGMGCQLNIYEYSSARNLLHSVVDVTKLLGWKDKTYTDGKIHGEMGIMPDGTLWATTHYGAIPDSSWYANGFRGSWLLSYNIYSHEAKNLGNPMIPSNLPYFKVDTKRGRLLATGSFETVLCWDTIEKKVRYAGSPPKGWVWAQRIMLLDEETGKFWNVDNNDKQFRIMSFDPEFNKFMRYEISPSANPFTKEVSITSRATERPAMDGWYYWTTGNGAMFKFKPEGPKGPQVVPFGTTWDKGRVTLQMAMDQTGRYIYYYPKGDAPIVQLDVKTGKRKALCWLQDYFFDKYGYFMDQVYGMNISKDGSFLVCAMNGEFSGKGDAFGHPALLVVEIPKEERPID